MTVLALSSSQRSSIQKTTSNAAGLPAESYIHEDWLKTERERIFASEWTAVGFVHNLACKSVTPVELIGLPLVIVRDEIGTIRVFHNVCRHRGRQLVDEPHISRGQIRCPYHSWTYDLSGCLVGTPHIGGHGIHELENFKRASLGLFDVRSVVWMDILFVNLASNASSFSEHIAPLEARWSQFTGVGNLNNARPEKNQDPFNIEVIANWKLLVENYCESYHLPWVHPGLNSYSNIEHHYTIIADDWGAGQGTTVFNFCQRAGIDLSSFLEWPAHKRNIAEYIALYPNVLLGLHVDHFYAVVLLPITACKTREEFQLYYVGDHALSDSFIKDRKVLLNGWREVFLEDIDPLEGMQRGRASTAFDGGAFSPVLDTGTHHFHKWVAARLT